MMMPASNGTTLHPSLLCQDSEKEMSFRRYGLLDVDDRGRVQDAGIRDVIEPVYRAGFKDVNIISMLIKSDLLSYMCYRVSFHKILGSFILEG